MRTRRNLAIQSCFAAVVAVVLLCARMPVGALAEELRSDEHTYAGVPLAQWRLRIVDFDASSPQAALAVAPLFEILSDDQVDDVTRRNAAIALGNIGEPARPIAPQLMHIVETGDDDALWAAKSLSLMGDAARDVTPALTMIAGDDDEPLLVRQLAIETLGRIAGAHPDAVPMLVQIAGGDDELALRTLAVEALGVAGRDAAVAAPILVRIIRNPRESDELRRRSVIALGALGDQSAVAAPPLVETLMVDDSQAVRDAAALSLASQGARGENILISLLSDGEADVRWRAAQALGSVKPAGERVIAALVQALDDADERVKLRAAESLVTLQADAALIIPSLLSLMQSEDRMTRVDAVELLVSLGEDAQAALPVLAEFTRNPRDDVRRAAKLAIKRLNAEELPE